MRSISKHFSWFLLLAVAFTAGSSQAYYGRHSTEAMLTYDAWLDVPEEQTKKEVEASIREQLQYLIGDFQSQSFREQNGFSGMPGEDLRFKITSSGPSETYGNKRYYYSFQGKTIFSKKIFRSGKSVRALPIRLPLDLDVYYLGMRRDINLCTDREFNGYSDFWYFWDPDMEKCPLKGDSKNVIRIEGRLEMIPNTKLTYPEYDRLYSDNGNGDLFEISIFLGYISAYNPEKPSPWDDGAKSFRAITQELRDRGFESVEEKKAFRVSESGVERKGANHYQVFESGTTRIKILLSDTSYESRDATFHHYVVPALEKSDLFVYDGHSELGEALGFHNLPTIRFSQKKYQIFFFNGCNSYPYYNGQYLARKGGSQNLEVITAGLPTLVSSTVSNVLSFITPFIERKEISYQTLMSRLDSANESDTFLFGVSGDEDNQYFP